MIGPTNCHSSCPTNFRTTQGIAVISFFFGVGVLGFFYWMKMFAGQKISWASDAKISCQDSENLNCHKKGLALIFARFFVGPSEILEISPIRILSFIFYFLFLWNIKLHFVPKYAFFNIHNWKYLFHGCNESYKNKYKYNHCIKKLVGY